MHGKRKGVTFCEAMEILLYFCPALYEMDCADADYRYDQIQYSADFADDSEICG
ncbi:hypothetical protein D3C74_466260 [compost metagenome]